MDLKEDKKLTEVSDETQKTKTAEELDRVATVKTKKEGETESLQEVAAMKLNDEKKNNHKYEEQDTEKKSKEHINFDNTKSGDTEFYKDTGIPHETITNASISDPYKEQITESDMQNKTYKESRQSSTDKKQINNVHEVNKKFHITKPGKSRTRSSINSKENNAESRTPSVKSSRSNRENSISRKQRVESPKLTSNSLRQPSETLVENLHLKDKDVNETLDNKNAKGEEEKQVITETLKLDNNTTGEREEDPEKTTRTEKSDESKHKKHNTDDKETRQNSNTVAKRSVPGQVRNTTASSSTNKMKRTHVFQRKNKIDPTYFIHTKEDNIRTRMLIAQQRREVDNVCGTKHLPEILSNEQHEVPSQESILDSCPSCNRRKRLLPASHPFQYCNVSTDKWGRIYCEYCAKPNSIKIIDKLRSNHQKRLRCWGCGNVLHMKTVKDVEGVLHNETNVCQQCGQPQICVTFFCP